VIQGTPVSPGSGPAVAADELAVSLLSAYEDAVVLRGDEALAAHVHGQRARQHIEGFIVLLKVRRPHPPGRGAAIGHHEAVLADDVANRARLSTGRVPAHGPRYPASRCGD
jgi:hypothetical protein